MAKIIVKINKFTGEVKVSAEGYAGESCKEKTRPFEQRLGRVVDDQATPEMYTQETQDETQSQH